MMLKMPCSPDAERERDYGHARKPDSLSIAECETEIVMGRGRISRQSSVISISNRFRVAEIVRRLAR